MTTTSSYKPGDTVEHNGKVLTIASTDYDVLTLEDSKGAVYVVSAFDIDPTGDRS
jgi:hypothetical protein